MVGGLRISNPTADEALHAEEPLVQAAPTPTPQEVDAKLQGELERLTVAAAGAAAGGGGGGQPPS
jgi:hypothetical protein